VKRIRGSGKNLRRLLLHPDFIVFIIITGIAFSIRLIYLYQIRAIPFFSAPLIDAQAYLVQAVKVSSGNLIGHEAFWQPPLYPYLLGWLVHLFGLNAFKIYLVQVAAGSLSAGLIYILGRNVFDRKVGALAGLAASLYGPFMFYEVQLLIPFLIVLLDLVLLILLLRYRQKGSLRHAAGSGLVLGLSAIARPNILLFGPAAAIWLLWTERGRLKVGPAFHRILAFFLACAAVVAVVTVRNYSVGGQFILISWNGGANFYLGNNRNWKETVSVRPGFAWDDLMDRPAHQGFLKETERSDYFYSKALDDIKDHPLWWMSLLGYKFYLFFHGHPCSPSWYGSTGYHSPSVSCPRSPCSAWPWPGRRGIPLQGCSQHSY
jgi:4-amino-4-deoxy-L-arabinose transferase-like glycosyltransferase